jgi:4-oxalocrotonate tautomerase
MPIVNIQILKGRPEEKIRNLIANVSTTVAETLEVPVERVRVLITEVPHTHWGVGGQPMSEKNQNR